MAVFQQNHRNLKMCLHYIEQIIQHWILVFQVQMKLARIIELIQIIIFVALQAIE